MITIQLPWTKPPMVANDRQHHMVKAKAFREALSEARWAIRAAKVPPMVGASVTLHYRVPDKRRRDSDGIAPTLKVCLDALVYEGALVDDSWIHVPQSGQTIHPPDGKPGMWLTLEPTEESA